MPASVTSVGKEMGQLDWTGNPRGRRDEETVSARRCGRSGRLGSDPRLEELGGTIKLRHKVEDLLREMEQGWDEL